MDDIMSLLNKKMYELDQTIRQAEYFMKKAPSGSIRISKNNGSDQYYWRNDPKDTHGRYINKSQHELIQSLVQKAYTKKLLTEAYDEKKCLEQFMSGYHPERMADIYDNLNLSKKKIVIPYVRSDDEYANQWQNQIYNMSRGFQEEENEIMTEKGERVRSKSEKILADKFNFMNIPYHYEIPLNLAGYGIIYPDFILLNKRTRKEYFWEHFGLMTDANYCEKAIRKIETMQKNGIFPGDNLILTYETQTHVINIKIVDGLIQKYLM